MQNDESAVLLLILNECPALVGPGATLGIIGLRGFGGEYEELWACCLRLHDFSPEYCSQLCSCVMVSAEGRRRFASQPFGPGSGDRCRSARGDRVGRVHLVSAPAAQTLGDVAIAAASQAGSVVVTSMTVQRRHLYCGLAVVGFANGASDRIGETLARDSVLSAMLATFGISVVVWSAALAAIWLLLHAEHEPVRKTDIAVAMLAALAFLLPIPPLSWLALIGIAVYLANTVPAGPMRRAAGILAAMTVPMFWARLLFAALSGPILAIDASLVSWVVGTESVGNMVPFADGSGVLFLEPACSSFTNMSLVLLCGVVIVKVYDQPWSAGIVRAVIAACVATIAINIFRMSLIGVFPAYYDMIHGPVGVTLAEWLTIIVVAGIYAGGIRIDEPAHA